MGVIGCTWWGVATVLVFALAGVLLTIAGVMYMWLRSTYEEEEN